MKTKIKTSIVVLLSLVTFYSCLDVVNFDPTNRFTNEVAFSSNENVNLYLNSFYPIIAENGQFGSKSLGNNGSMSDALTEQLKYGGIVPGAGDPNLIMTVDNNVNVSANPFDAWSSGYSWIRKINEFLKGLEQNKAKFGAKANTFEAEVRFFRAYSNFLMMRAHASEADNLGIITYASLDEMSSDVKNRPRKSVSDSWDFIEADLNFCITDGYLPKSRYAGGRLTYYAAQALKARAMLYAKRYNSAKTAALAIQSSTDFGFMDDYSSIFKTSDNTEVVFGFEYKMNVLTHNFDYEFVPSGDKTGKGGTAGPTQEFVDEYDLVDGSPFSVTTNSNIRFVTEDNVNQRDPRLKATVLYNGANWKGRNIECCYYESEGRYSLDMLRFPYGNYNAPGNTVTGYYMRKLLDESNLEFVANGSYQPWNEFRYAETVLILAECYAMESNFVKVHDLLNDLRKVRFHNPSVITPTPSTVDQAINQILKERSIELAFEGQRFWDLRRTGKARQTLNGKLYNGVLWTVNGVVKTPTLVSCELGIRLYPQRFDAFPIPISEITNNTLAVQNSNW